MLKEINPEYLLERLQLKMNTLAMQRADLMEKTLMLGKIKGRRRRGWQRMRWLDSITDSNEHESEQTPGDSKGQVNTACCDPWGRKERDTTWQLN